jgi:hypothetical protein
VGGLFPEVQTESGSKFLLAMNLTYKHGRQAPLGIKSYFNTINMSVS